MKTLVKNEFRQTRKTLLIWLGIMLLLCGFCYFELLSLKDSLDEMARTVGQFPRLIMIMFGVKGDLTTALGWYACIYFWEGLLAFAYAISLGLSCVAREKKFGTSEYLFTKPVERKTIVLAKVIVSAVNLLVFALFSGVCNYFTIVLPLGGLDQPGAVLSTTMGMFFTQLLFLPWVCCLPAFSNLIRPRYAPVRFSYWPPMCWPLLPSTQGIVSWII